MHFLADESVDRQIVESLRSAGHDVLYVAEMEPGINDLRVLEQANARSAILITADKDFGELVFRMRQVSAGIVLLRLAGLAPDAKALLLTGVLREHGVELAGAFTVVWPGAVRIRRR